jgi:hypothetical protein
MLLRVCAKVTFVACGAASKEAYLFMHASRMIVPSEAAWLRL